MEENKKIQVNNKILYTDTSPEFQPEGTSRYRLNAIPESNLGEQGNFSNELGNISKIVLPNNNLIIGHIPILDNKTIIFSVREDNSNSEIGLYNEKFETYITLINANCLSFKITNQVRGEFKVREGCNTNIYFTDNTNPWRAIDIDNLDQYKDNLGNWDCNSFKLFRDYNQTNVDMQVFNTGGNTKVGMYQFTYQYLDDDFNPQPWNIPSNPIPIVKDSLNEYTGLDGDVTNTDTNKSIQITISNIDTRYKFVRIGLITSILGTGFNSNAYILEEVPVENNSITYLFSGIDPNKTQNTDLESFQYLPPDYYTGKDLTQIDNSLVLAYPKAREVDYVPFIQAALQIQSRYNIKDLFAEATGETSFGNRYPNSYFYNKSLMRDEVYSFGIVYIFKDGTETPAFHIPGRAKDFDSTGTFIDSQKYERRILVPSITPNPNFNLHNRANTTQNVSASGGWDSVKYDPTAPDIEPNIISNTQIDSDGVERWRIFNTAIRTESTPDSGGYFTSKGELAYWESQDYTYPDTVDCSGNYIYPDEFRNKPVRYHKMPDATLEPHFYGYGNLTNPTTQEFACIRPLNIEFTNINIPTQYADQIQGYRIVRVERNDFNSSVVDKGILHPNTAIISEETNQLTQYCQTLPFGTRLDILGDSKPTTSNIDEFDVINGFNCLSFHSPKTKVFKDITQGDYIKIERSLFDSPVMYGPTNASNRDGINDLVRDIYDEATDRELQLDADKTALLCTTVRYNNSTIPLFDTVVFFNHTNRKITKQGYILANGNVPEVLSVPFLNNTQLETYGVETEFSVDNSKWTNTLTETALKFFDPNINNILQDTSDKYDLYFANQMQACKSSVFYASLKRYLPNQYNGLSQQVYTNPSNISTGTSLLYSNGDTFISDWAYKKTTDNAGALGELPIPGGWSSSDVFAIRSISRFWCESTVNMELRNGENIFEITKELVPGEGGDPNIAPERFNAIHWYYPKNYTESQKTVVDILYPEDAWKEGRYGTVRNYYAYNKDFSIENTTRFFFPLPINYDYCNTCRVKFPHRLANSNKAYQEERADNYRIFLPNNYRDIPGNTGSINEVFVKNNKLFIHTLQSLWEQQVKPQQIKTDQATLYVGTGEFWEIPPNEILTSLNGYAGCQHQFSTINTPFGYFWVSERERKIFLFNDKLTEISNQGLRNWFENNLEFSLDPITISLLGTDNPSNPIGVGFTVSYDKRYRRIILSKKDYKPIPNSGVVFNVPTKKWLLGDEEINNPYDRIDLFENKSWTISYHPDSQGFISYHSYLPYYMFNTQNHFYTFKDNEGFKHNEGNFQTYYQDKYPYIVEYTVPYQTTNLIDNINYYNKVYSFDTITNNWIEQPLSTYDRLIVYNDTQATPELTIIAPNAITPVPFQSVQNILNTEILATKVEEDWNVSGFIDYTNTANTSIFTTDWTQLQNQYPIDKVLNQSKLDTGQSVFDLKQFRSKFINYRLISNNAQNLKYVSKYDTTKVRSSDR